MKLNQYQDVVSGDFLDPDETKCVFALVLDHLGLAIIRERTPDYTSFQLVQRDTLPSQDGAKR